MRLVLFLTLLFLPILGCLAWGPSSSPSSREMPKPADKPFGIPKRIPWTTSRVVGSPDPPLPYRVRRVFPQLRVANPISIAHEPGTEQLLLVQQLWPWVGPGRILRVKEGTGDRTEVLLNLDRTIYGLAFHPDFQKNGYLYIGSNGPVTAEDRDLPGRRFRPGAAKTTRISRFTIARTPPFGCDPRSEKVILEWPSNGHNGGDLAFGKDGMLYISSGDGTSDSDTGLAGQDLSRLLAKVLRIDVDRPEPGQAYSVPKDNPFAGPPGQPGRLGGDAHRDARVRPETWAYGFRNPWRLHVDRQTGDVWVGNNGQDLWEQIYLVERGANYGWSLVEGTHPFLPQRKQGPTPISKPIAEHSHSEARSLTGGLVYRGTKLPELQGAYLYGDWSTGKVWGLRHSKGKVTWHRQLADTTLQVVGFGTDSHGELLILDYGGGIYQLEPAPKETEPTRFPTRLSETGLFESVQGHRPAAGLLPYSVNAPLWSDGAEKDRFLAIPGEGRIDFTGERGWNFPDGTVLVKTFSLLLRAERSDLAQADRDALADPAAWEVGRLLLLLERAADGSDPGGGERSGPCLFNCRSSRACRQTPANLALPKPGRVPGLSQPGRQFRAGSECAANEQGTQLRWSDRQPAPHPGASRSLPRQFAGTVPGGQAAGPGWLGGLPVSARPSCGLTPGTQGSGTVPAPPGRRRPCGRSAAPGVWFHQRPAAPNGRISPAG